MYAAILHLTFPPTKHEEVAKFLSEEMLSVIRVNEGFIDFRVLDAGTPGELVIMDTWRSREDSAAAIQGEEAVDVHARYVALEIVVASATRYSVIAST
ncbi:antibiotic biosynthesis monooxygenase family protein [Rhizocola hellebori]|nr:antibiotic biosynthesis monooxygenase [Rhizocola hellebori]